MLIQIPKVKKLETASDLITLFFKNGQFPASFSLFSTFQHKVDNKQMFNI